MRKIRVLLADDHAILRAGLRMLIDAQEDMEVVGEAENGDGAVRKARRLRPDVVILDLAMPGPPSAETTAAIVAERPRTRVLVLTMHDDPGYLRPALLAGASGFVVKRAADAELLLGIRAVHRGGTFIDPALAGSLTRGRKRPILGRREREVLRLLAEGHTNKEIASRLSVSVKTVETHRARLGEKLGLRGRSQLFRYAVEAGILTLRKIKPGDAKG